MTKKINKEYINKRAIGKFRKTRSICVICHCPGFSRRVVCQVLSPFLGSAIYILIIPFFIVLSYIRYIENSYMVEKNHGHFKQHFMLHLKLHNATRLARRLEGRPLPLPSPQGRVCGGCKPEQSRLYHKTGKPKYQPRRKPLKYPRICAIEGLYSVTWGIAVLEHKKW